MHHVYVCFNGDLIKPRGHLQKISFTCRASDCSTWVIYSTCSTFPKKNCVCCDSLIFWVHISFLHLQVWQENESAFDLLLLSQFKLLLLDLEKQKGWQALLGLSGLAVLHWCSDTSLTKHNRQVSETPKSKTDHVRTLMFLLLGVSVNESFCTGECSRLTSAAQMQLRISQLPVHSLQGISEPL